MTQIDDDQRDFFAAMEKSRHIYADGFSKGIWGEAHCAPYPIDTEGYHHWIKGYYEGAQIRYQTLDFCDGDAVLYDA